ncbi:MAG: hypothetical protein E6R08_02905 [Nevskiaceae bacterium]|nr:MAG: hypothetical protein E6R08_02905 [Nevskiaceae bacterium]
MDLDQIEPYQVQTKGIASHYEPFALPFAPNAFPIKLRQDYVYYGRVKVWDFGEQTGYGSVSTGHVRLVMPNELEDKRAPEPMGMLFGEYPSIGYHEDMPDVLFNLALLGESFDTVKISFLFIGWRIKLRT